MPAAAFRVTVPRGDMTPRLMSQGRRASDGDWPGDSRLLGSMRRRHDDRRSPKFVAAATEPGPARPPASPGHGDLTVRVWGRAQPETSLAARTAGPGGGLPGPLLVTSHGWPGVPNGTRTGVRSHTRNLKPLLSG